MLQTPAQLVRRGAVNAPAPALNGRDNKQTGRRTGRTINVPAGTTHRCLPLNVRGERPPHLLHGPDFDLPDAFSGNAVFGGKLVQGGGALRCHRPASGRCTIVRLRSSRFASASRRPLSLETVAFLCAPIAPKVRSRHPLRDRRWGSDFRRRHPTAVPGRHQARSCAFPSHHPTHFLRLDPQLARNDIHLFGAQGQRSLCRYWRLAPWRISCCAG